MLIGQIESKKDHNVEGAENKAVALSKLQDKHYYCL